MKTQTEVIEANWPAPSHVRAFVSTRNGGVSQGAYNSLNLGAHVGDKPADVLENRVQFSHAIHMPDSLRWLNQVHGTEVIELPSRIDDLSADGAFTKQASQVCAVLTADCLPVFFCNKEGTRVAATHAGWRGLCNGILEQTLQNFPETEEVMVWLGPAIGPSHFEVGEDVKAAFVTKDAMAITAFVPHVSGKWFADLYQLARQRLLAQGVTQIFGGDHCTFAESDTFYSYRRDGVTGRMASVIWFEEH